MDPKFDATHGFVNGYKLDDGTVVSNPDNFPNPEKEWGLHQHYQSLNFTSDPLYQPYVDPVNFAPHTGLNFEGEQLVSSWTMDPGGGVSDVAAASTTSLGDPSLDDADFSETIKYIGQILMEENFEQKPSMFYDPLSLQITEKSFYDALRENQSLSPTEHPLDIHQNLDSPDGNCSGGSSIDSGSNSSSTNNSHEANKPSSPDAPVSGDSASQLNSHSISDKPSKPPSSSTTNISDGLLDLDLSISKLLARDIFNDMESVSQFKRGLEEASKFLPRVPQLVTGLESNKVSSELKREAGKAVTNIRENSHGSKGRKNHEREDSDTEEEGRSNKQSAVYVDESEVSEMFDRVLLSVENVPLCDGNKGLQNGTVKAKEPSERSRSSDGGKTRSKRQGKKKETVDLRTLLVLCAQAVSANDSRTANELLKQIRQHSSPLGDGSQRLAHYFANGLEARLVGASTGTQIFYTSLNSKRISASDILKAYSVLISVCPFKKLVYFFANKMIMEAAAKAESLHIIDFGIQYGFQWPILVKFLSKRAGGPPKLRITGIEYPQAGFRPAERIEETGRRLANYCKRFDVPFEYKAIASQNWETIPLEDFKIESNELLAVNCLIRFKNLLDETIEVNSPRNAVLNLIRKMNPDIFVQSVLNGSYNAPFFATRFKEAVFHFSAMYDMFDTLIPRDNEWRLMIEREFLGREAMNVVACEGIERVERPESYKQWQVRNTRAGFKQLPLNEELMAKFREKLMAWYHKDFVFDEDNNWMLQGWKGRILYASASWVPA